MVEIKNTVGIDASSIEQTPPPQPPRIVSPRTLLTLRILCWSMITIIVLGFAWVGYWLWEGYSDLPQSKVNLMALPLAAPPMLIATFVLWFATAKAGESMRITERRLFLGAALTVGFTAAIAAILS